MRTNTNTNSITIGRDVALTIEILNGIRQREQRSINRRRRWRWLRQAAARLGRIAGCTNTLNPPTEGGAA
jgi:hypothetical protein